MKYCWTYGCVFCALHFGRLAIEGNGPFGDVWWARSLDGLAVVAFAVAAVTALMQRAPWLVPWRR